MYVSVRMLPPPRFSMKGAAPLASATKRIGADIERLREIRSGRLDEGLRECLTGRERHAVDHEVESTVLLVDGLIERVNLVVSGHVTLDELRRLTQRFREGSRLFAEPFVCVAEREAGARRVGSFGYGPSDRPLVGNTDNKAVGPA